MSSFEWPPTGGGGGGGSGTVTEVSVASTNGFAGTVANPTTTPALTLKTTITGIIKGNGTAISAATAGTDYIIPSGSITGTATNITASSNSTLTTLSSLSLPASQLSGLSTAVASLTAANISATSNSTLTTLSALSLPTSQLSGTINFSSQASGTLQAAQEPAHTGDVTNSAGSLALALVATTNSTLTTLSSLALPEAQVTGLNAVIGAWAAIGLM